MNRIVVGVDGSAGSAAALGWAVALAERWPAQLDTVLAWEVRAPALAPHPPRAQAEAEMQETAEAVMQAMHEAAATPADSGRHIVNGPVVATLVDAAQDADLLVVGAHGTDGLIAGIGSIAARCAVHSTVPTAVIPSAGEAVADGPVVVGVDGSAGGVRALGMALRLTPPGRTIDAVNAWTVPAVTGPAIAALDPDIFAEGGQIALDESLATLTDEDRARVTPRLEHGPSRVVLRRAAEGASMVVVGTRGHSTLLHRLLGSSVTYLLHHHPTPIVVVPAEADPTEAD